MRGRVTRLGLLVLMVATGFFLAGCATGSGGGVSAGPSQTDLLKQAGFKVYTAKTPKKQAYLQTLPVKQVVANKYQGQVHYLVRTDPASPHCYVGDDAAYQRYQQSALQAAIAQDQHKVSSQRWDPEALQMWADSQGAGP